MKSTTRLFVACHVALVASMAAPAQTVLSDFSGPDADGWTGSISGVTPFANGFTNTTGVINGSDVLQLSDSGGFAGGALRIYTGLPTTGFVTVSCRARIATDAGNLTTDPNANPGTFGCAFGVAAGGAALDEQAFGYGRSLSTPADDSNQPVRALRRHGARRRFG